MRLEPEKGGPYRTLGNIQLALGDLDAKRPGGGRAHFEKALEMYGQALRQNRTDATAFNNRGNAHLKLASLDREAGENPRPHFDRARADYTEALRINPGLVEAHFNRGSIHVFLGEIKAERGSDPAPHYREALQDYDHVLRVRPALWLAFERKGAVLERLDRPSEAVGCYESALRLAGAKAPASLRERLARARTAAKARDK